MAAAAAAQRFHSPNTVQQGTAPHARSLRPAPAQVRQKSPARRNAHVPGVRHLAVRGRRRARGRVAAGRRDSVREAPSYKVVEAAVSREREG